ncbi:hypothetical protein BU073_01610 [Mammaliicoccus vitulinus]|nr:hypothetical protein BU073_01610 [Mammaliicoccus vitulinus]
MSERLQARTIPPGKHALSKSLDFNIYKFVPTSIIILTPTSLAFDSCESTELNNFYFFDNI